MILVIGKSRASRQDFRRKVGIGSRQQEALDEESMAARTCCWVTGANEVREGGGDGGLR